VILLPAIEIAPPTNPEPLRRAAHECNAYDWIVFTSVNAVAAFMAEFRFQASDCKARIGAIGAATRKALEERRFAVSITPNKYVAEALVEAFASEELNGRRILIPSAAATRDVVATELRKRGAQVDVVEAYRNVTPPAASERAHRVFGEPYPDWVIFASSSAVDNLVSLIGIQAISRTKIASIGPITSNTVRSYGLSVAVEARVHSVEGLVEAVASFKTGL
jgi:uroporphyrinogen-III synthase